MPVCKDVLDSKTKYSMQIGKKLINFYDNSRISDTSCVKIYDETVLTLPGGFGLPVILITETWIYYDLLTAASTEELDFQWLSDYSKDYLQGQMIAGQILTTNETSEFQDGVFCYTANYACREMIGQVKKEETIQYNGKNS